MGEISATYISTNALQLLANNQTSRKHFNCKKRPLRPSLVLTNNKEYTYHKENTTDNLKSGIFKALI